MISSRKATKAIAVQIVPRAARADRTEADGVSEGQVIAAGRA
nr:hypothetical protein [Streptomyces sp. DSM 15324]